MGTFLFAFSDQPHTGMIISRPEEQALALTLHFPPSPAFSMRVFAAIDVVHDSGMEFSDPYYVMP